MYVFYLLKLLKKIKKKLYDKTINIVIQNRENKSIDMTKIQKLFEIFKKLI